MKSDDAYPDFIFYLIFIFLVISSLLYIVRKYFTNVVIAGI